MARRTTHRSKSGKKLYAVRNKKGEFEDIQTYERAHSRDVKRKSKAEKAAKKKKTAKKKVGKKRSTKKTAKKSSKKKKQAARSPKELLELPAPKEPR